MHQSGPWHIGNQLVAYGCRPCAFITRLSHCQTFLQVRITSHNRRCSAQLFCEIDQLRAALGGEHTTRCVHATIWHVEKPLTSHERTGHCSASIRCISVEFVTISNSMVRVENDEIVSSPHRDFLQTSCCLRSRYPLCLQLIIRTSNRQRLARGRLARTRRPLHLHERRHYFCHLRSRRPQRAPLESARVKPSARSNRALSRIVAVPGLRPPVKK